MQGIKDPARESTAPGPSCTSITHKVVGNARLALNSRKVIHQNIGITAYKLASSVCEARLGGHEEAYTHEGRVKGHVGPECNL